MISHEHVKHLWGNRPCKWAYVGAMGTSGGILIIWDDSKVDIIDTIEGQFSLTVKLRNREDNREWMHTNIYRPVDHQDKEDFWVELAAIGGFMEPTMVYVGRF